MGRSYLCRMIDMLNMGYVDEVLFGREVLQRLPELVAEWVSEFRSRGMQSGATLAEQTESLQARQ